MLRIERADLDDPALIRFLEDHLRDLAPTAPPESRHALDLEALRGPGVRVWVAREDGDVVGTAALSALVRPSGADEGNAAGHEELKSMRTDPSRRGKGVASTLLARVLADARERGVERVSLETGSMDFFAPARAFYAKSGFTPCAPFGSYSEDPNSVFMTLEL